MLLLDLKINSICHDMVKEASPEIERLVKEAMDERDFKG
jgi:hypothetical protein